jgi:hypothetical protein
MLYGYTSTNISQCRHACTHTHTHTHTYIYIYIYTHTQTRVLFCVWTIYHGQIISLVPNNKTSVSCSKRKRTVLWACICLVRSEITKKGKSEIRRLVVRICSYQTKRYHISEDHNVFPFLFLTNNTVRFPKFGLILT